MQRKVIVSVLLMSMAVWGLVSPAAAQQRKNDNRRLSQKVKVSSVKTSSRADTIYVDFKLLRDGRKVFDPSLFRRSVVDAFVVNEVGSSDGNCPQVDTLLDIREKKSMADDLSVMLLIDRSSTISDDLLLQQKRVVKSFLDSMPDTKLYIAFMNDGEVTQTVIVDTTSWKYGLDRQFDKEMKQGEKNLYRSILSKLQELSGEKQTYYPNVVSLSGFQYDEGEKLLFVFTDGKVKDEKGEYYGGAVEFANMRDDYFDREDDILEGRKKNIPVYCVYIGEKEELDTTLANALAALCSTGTEEDVKGRFYTTLTPDSLQELMMGTLDSIAADYRLVLLNPEGKLYDGSPLSLQITVLDKDGEPFAYGERNYSLGTVVAPIKVRYEDVGSARLVFIGLLLGILLIAAVYLILQFLVPFIQYKYFLKRYVVPYQPGEFVEEKTCYWCKEKLERGDIVVTKCEHVVHKECWEENHNRCPEYGRHKCKKGIHYYNQENKADPKNSTHFLLWIMAGFVAGLAGWLLFKLFSSFDMFSGLMSSIAGKLFPSEGEIDLLVLSAMATKSSQWLQIGISLGFFIVLAFGYVFEYRKLDLKVACNLLLKSMVGAVVGFIAFLLGGIIVTLFGKSDTCWYVDWIPWLFFALATSVVLWYKTEIKLNSALIGGAISVLFSFLVMYVFTGNYTPVLGYMIYAAGLGCSIAVVHFASEKYFLRIDGSVKERDIAIYKWMSVTGGFNKVSIGKSNDCVLQMNWDKSENISDRAVELYIQNDRPYLKVLDSGVIQNGRVLPVGTTVLLMHGSEFKIGNTHFTYIEKDQ